MRAAGAGGVGARARAAGRGRQVRDLPAGRGRRPSASSARWRARLFEQCTYEPDLDADERDRYQVANDNARRYAASLERRFVARRAMVDMFVELRRFYRLPLAGKLDAIGRAA
ncbi:MAG: hypothetical protein IPL61_08685 [Myxococcales bacterium]|nr:hypothetical protein [Myxococcales bacterium]